MATLLIAGCNAEPAPTGRVLVIAVDGASTRLIAQLMDEGRLPNFSALARVGSSGVSRPELPLLSPRIWTDVVTGKLPERHGIQGWVHLSQDGTPHLYSSRDRTAHALWNILSDAGLKVGVVNWLMTHPPEVVNGIMVSDHAADGMMEDKRALAQTFADKLDGTQGEVRVDSPTGSFVSPSTFRSQVEAERSAPPFTEISNPFADLQDWPRFGFLGDFMRQVYDNDDFAASVALRIESEIQPDLLLVYLPGVDRISHFLWDAVEPIETIPEALRRPPEVVVKHARALIAYYEYVDQVIGRLVQNRSPEDLVIVMSDHGFEIDPKSDVLRGVHDSPAARDGILFMRGRGVPKGRSDLVMNMVDVAPTILAWLGMPPATDMDGVPAVFMETDTPTPIASYDTTPIEYLGEKDEAVERRIIDDLKALGYVE